MRITGAVLEEAGRARPYAASAPITVCELELDAPREGELLVELEAACVCHSDLAVVDGTRPRPAPMLLGHEAAGIVLDAPGDELPTGTRVVMTFLPRCGECAACATNGRIPCTAGSEANSAGKLLRGGSRLRRGNQQINHHLGVSAFATHAVVDLRSVVPVESDVPAAVSALLGCAVLTGGGALLNAAPPVAGETVAVVGLGGVGLASLMTARALGVRRVVGIDANPSKLDVALGLGAHEVYSSVDATRARVAADIVIEAAGHPSALETALACSAAGARVVSVGLPSPAARASISPLELVAGGRTLIGSYLGSALPSRDIPIFADLWRAGRFPVESLVSDEVELRDINLAMDRLANGDVVRQLIHLNAEGS